MTLKEFIESRKGKKPIEELTTRMHAEFSVSEATEKKHTAFSALGCIADGMSQDIVLSLYKQLNKADLQQHLSAFNQLSVKQVTLE